MDPAQYSSLLVVVRRVPEPRKARGKQLEGTFILGVIATALLCQQGVPQPSPTRCCSRPSSPPADASESTLRRALQRLDVGALERELATARRHRRPRRSPQPPGWWGTP